MCSQRCTDTRTTDSLKTRCASQGKKTSRSISTVCSSLHTEMTPPPVTVTFRILPLSLKLFTSLLHITLKDQRHVDGMVVGFAGETVGREQVAQGGIEQHLKAMSLLPQASSPVENHVAQQIGEVNCRTVSFASLPLRLNLLDNFETLFCGTSLPCHWHETPISDGSPSPRGFAVPTGAMAETFSLPFHCGSVVAAPWFEMNSAYSLNTHTTKPPCATQSSSERKPRLGVDTDGEHEGTGAHQELVKTMSTIGLHALP